MAHVKKSSSTDEDPSNSAMDIRKLMTMVGAFYWLLATVIVVPTGCLCTLFLVLYPLLGVIYLFGLE